MEATEYSVVNDDVKILLNVIEMMSDSRACVSEDRTAPRCAGCATILVPHFPVKTILQSDASNAVMD
jgi:hypothetical protein